MVGATLLPLSHEWAGRYEHAFDIVDNALKDESSDVLAYLFGRWTQAIVRSCRGEYQWALDTIVEDVEFAGRIGEILMYLRALNTVGFLYGELQDFERAIVWNTRGFDEAVAVGLPDPEIEGNAALNVGDNLMAMGRSEEAEERFQFVERIYRNPTPFQRFMLWRYSQHMLHSYGELWLARGDHAKAIAYADECLELAERSDSPKNVVKGRRLRGQALMTQGKLDEASIELEASVNVARDIGNVGQLWRSLAALGDLRVVQAREGDARDIYRDAMDVIDRIAGGLTEDRLRNTFLSSEAVASIRAQAT
jgi:tetratricopeptide (TPR) repeat protein